MVSLRYVNRSFFQDRRSSGSCFGGLLVEIWEEAAAKDFVTEQRICHFECAGFHLRKPHGFPSFVQTRERVKL